MVKEAEIIAAVRASWDGATSYAGDQLPPENPARAQCVSSSLVIQDYLGGELVRYQVSGQGFDEHHYCNRLADGSERDPSRVQYPDGITMTEIPAETGAFPTLRARFLADEETRRMYETLRRRVEESLGGTNESPRATDK